MKSKTLWIIGGALVVLYFYSRRRQAIAEEIFVF